MKIKLSGIVNDSIVDGPGIRMTIFTQGCSHHCPNCHNPQTHDPNGGYESDTDDILSAVSENPLLDGITLSGGDPFEQAQACSILGAGAHKFGLNVWTYTGYTWEEIIENHIPEQIELLKNTDVLVDGPFMEHLRSLEIRFKGSKNQRTISVSESLKNKKIILFE